MVRTCRVFDALISTNQSMMLMISPTSSRTMSVPFLSAAACAAAVARRDVTGSGTVKRGPRSASRFSVEAAGADLGHDCRWDEPVDRASRGEAGRDVARRDVEARDREALEPPAGAGGF